jgi:hypothetical protein
MIREPDCLFLAGSSSILNRMFPIVFSSVPPRYTWASGAA